jgi:hypothetical protein
MKVFSTHSDAQVAVVDFSFMVNALEYVVLHAHAYRSESLHIPDLKLGTALDICIQYFLLD